MSDQAAPGYSSIAREREVSGWAVGFILAAAVLMIMGGSFQALAGLVAIFNDKFYVVGREYLYQFDVTTWGWIHLIAGVVVGVAGFFLLSGALWARVIAIILAVLSAISNFMFVPYYPLWSLVIIALDVFIIWALTAHGRAYREASR